jgi:hypothetical protein
VDNRDDQIITLEGVRGDQLADLLRIHQTRSLTMNP